MARKVKEKLEIDNLNDETDEEEPMLDQNDQ